MPGAWVLPLTLVLSLAKQSLSLQQLASSNYTFTPSLNVSNCPGMRNGLHVLCYLMLISKYRL
jgi:hypothetical protein